MTVTRLTLWSLSVGLLALGASADTFQIAGGGCDLSLDARTARILSVNGTSLRSGEHGLWRVRLKSGTTLSAAEFEQHPEWRIERRGETFTFHEGHARVTVSFNAGPKGVDVTGTVTALKDDPVVAFELPARLRFAPEDVDRFYMPERGNQGLGFAFNRSFFEETSKLAHPTWKQVGPHPWKRNPASERKARALRELTAAAQATTRPKAAMLWLPCGPEWGSGDSLLGYRIAVTRLARAATNGFDLVLLRNGAELLAASRDDAFRFIFNPYGDLLPMGAAGELEPVKAAIADYVSRGGRWVAPVDLADSTAFVPGGYCSYAFTYPSLFMDFCQLRTTAGETLSLYGVRPRPPHAPRALDRAHEFVPGSLGCGGDARGGYCDHAFTTYLRKDETRRFPAVRLAAGRALRAAIDDYAQANDLTRKLTEKIDPVRLEKLSKAVNAVMYGGRHQALKKVVDRLPAPAIIHIQRYLKGGFDKEYPDHLPSNEQAFGTDADHRALIDRLHEKGHLYMPYTNPTWWCDHPRGPTFQAAGEAPLLVTESGAHNHEDYGKNDGWTTCLWHPAVLAANRRTVDAFTSELPVDILFQDQCGARRCPLDFNPASPSPTAYTEGMLAMLEEDSARVALGTEDGWDQVANLELGIFGCSWKTCPRRMDVLEGDYHLLNKELLPPETFTIEPLALYLMHDKCLFYHHDLSGSTFNARILVWQLATGANLSVNASPIPYLKDPAHRAWCDHIADIQRTVVRRLVGKKLTAWKHDRAPLFARTDVDAACREDDGVVTAQWEDATMIVNLGDVPRTVDGHALGPYGFWISPEVSAAASPCFILDEDNDHYFKNPSDWMDEAHLNAYIDGLAAGGKVTHLFLCPTGGRASFDSATWEPIWRGLEEYPQDKIFFLHRTWAENAKRLHDKGIDPYAVWIRRCREKGISPWLSPRMNDAHDGASSGRPFRNTTFWRTRKDLRCYPDHDRPSWRHHQFDYSHPEVRESALAMIRELFERYDFDGLNIHANRWFPDETARANIPVMMTFMREVRQIADVWEKKRGHRIGLSVCRAGFTPEECRERGFDAAAMAREGLLDIIVCHRDHGDGYEGTLPVEAWRKEVAPSRVKIVCGRGERLIQGTDRRSQIVPLIDYTAEMFRGWADRQFTAGADGVYLFNVEYEPKIQGEVARTGLAPADLAQYPRSCPVPTDRLPLKLTQPARFTVECGSATQGVVSVVAAVRGTSAPYRGVRLNGVEACRVERTRVVREVFNEVQKGEEQRVALDVDATRSIYPAEALQRGVNLIELPAIPAAELVYLELRIDPVPRPAENPYGIHTHLQERDWEQRDFECAFMRRMGLGHTRTDLYWRMAQQTPGGPWDFSRIRAVFDAAEAHGLQVEPILYGGHAWATPIWKHPEAFRAYVSAAFDAIGPNRFDIVEIHNEQNLTTFWRDTVNPTNYVKHLKVAYEAVKAKNPRVRVALGGLAGADASHDYLEGVYRAGGAPYFDVMNVHPYIGKNPPEGNLDCQLERMKALMAKYGDAEKPWIISETGYATHRVGDLALKLLLGGLRAADPDKKAWHLVVAAVASEVTRLDDGFPRMLEKHLPPGSVVEHLTPRQTVERLKHPGVDAVVYPFEEDYPADTVDAVAAFVAAGGLLVDLGGMPMWSRYRAPDGVVLQLENSVPAADDRAKLRVGVAAHWMRNDLARSTPCQVTAVGRAAGIELPGGSIPGEYFVTDQYLRPGDTFIPLVSGRSRTGREVAAMALVRFGSDWKGKLLLSGLRHEAATIYQPVDESLQAVYLLKTVAIAFAEGVSRFIWYDLHAREINASYSEHHFGICHRDYSPKPAMNAYATFIQRRPPGSVQLTRTWHDAARTRYAIQWRRPDGMVAGVLWKTTPDSPEDLRFSSSAIRFQDMEGRPLAPEKTADGYRVHVGQSPIFFEGGELTGFFVDAAASSMPPYRNGVYFRETGRAVSMKPPMSRRIFQFPQES